MKRVYKSPATPERLRSYVKAFPDETWEHFRRRNRRGYRDVKQQLLQDLALTMDGVFRGVNDDGKALYGKACLNILEQ